MMSLLFPRFVWNYCDFLFREERRSTSRMTLYLKHPKNSDVEKCLGALDLPFQSSEIHWVTGEEPGLIRNGMANLLKFTGVLYIKEDGGILWNTDAILGWFFSADDEQYRFLQWISTELKPAINELGKLTVDLPVELLRHLEKIDQMCSPYIFGVRAGAVDVSAFHEVKRLFSDQKVANFLAEKFPQLTGWKGHMENGNEWKKAAMPVLPPLKKKPVEPKAPKQQKPKTDEKKKSAQKQGTQKAAGDCGKGAAKSSSQPAEASEEDHVVVDAAEIAEAAKTWKQGPSLLRKPFKPVHPVLPCEDGSQRNILVTSALPYVNNVPHLGNIVGCVLSADVFARFCRLRGYRTLYVCGTDEYGTATETKALEMGLTPKEVCDKFNALHRKVYSWFNIEFDQFGRTTTSEQTEIAQSIFWDLHANGHLLEDTMEQLHCEQCDRFLADRFVEGTCPKCGYEDARGDQCDKCGQLMNAVELLEPKCKICRSAPKIRSSRHLFLDLPKLEGKLSTWMDGVCDDWTSNAKVISKSWIKDGLKPRCITRDLKWGTPVPMEGYTDKVFYVWYDAPIGYPSITKCYTPDWQKWWMNPKNVELFMFMGKDNVPFHAVIFPSCLLGSGRDWTLVNRLCATEYLNYEDGKFSKSRGQGVFGDQAEELGLPADLWRFYLLAVRPESQDSAFNWVDMQTRCNSELLNNLGNFINRVLSFLEKNFDSVVPQMAVGEDAGSIAKENGVIAARVQKLLTDFVDLFERVKIRDALRTVLAISKIGNQHMQASKPWVLIKGDEREKAEAGSLIGFCTNIVCLLGAMLHPFMPSTSKEIFSQLNASEDLLCIDGKFTCFVQPGHRIGKPSPLFQKIESSSIEEYKKRFAGKEASPAPAAAKGAGDAKKTPSKTSNAVANGAPADPELVARLTEEVTKQGNVVRDLKTSKAEKSAVDVEVAKLLALKKQLAEAQGVDPAAASEGDKKKGGKKKGKK